MLIVVLIVLLKYSVGYKFDEISLNYLTNKQNYPTNIPLLSNSAIIDEAVLQLHNTYIATDIDECTSCKMRLQIGKVLALSRPDLVPAVYLTWCQQEGFDQSNCKINFGYPSDEYASSGYDFTKMIQNMDTVGQDGALFCYYHDTKCHVLPELPKVILSNLWPPRPKLYEAPLPNGETFNVLHISDFSLQVDYLLTSESNCSQRICCSSCSQNNVHPPENYDNPLLSDFQFGLSYYESTYKSGHFQKGSFAEMYKLPKKVWAPSHEFGSYSCDSPELLINNSLQILRDFHENYFSFEFGIFTGGMSDHFDGVNKTLNSVLRSQIDGFRNIHHYLENFPIYSTFGVNDNFPVNQLPLNSLDKHFAYQWQFDLLADLWQQYHWIDLKAAQQIRYNKIGYSVVTKRGLKIISLNSNVWNTNNLYVFIDTLSFDPFGIWKFLINELVDSEINEQRVWIIAHLPPSSNSMPVSTKIFQRIVERFSPKVIAALFFGYNLKDQFNLIYAGDGTNKDLNSLVNFALIGPSITPLDGNNPAWRYYSVDTESFDIMNSFTYYTKLNTSFVNDGAEPVWEFEYSAREAWDPDSSWPNERALDKEFWHFASEKIRDIPKFNYLYTNLEYRKSPLNPYHYDDVESNDTTILESDNYCKVTSFTILNKKECMITDDQDNFIEPDKQKTYVPLFKPYHHQGYALAVPAKDDSLQQGELSNREAKTNDDQSFEENDYSKFVSAPLGNKKVSTRERIQNKHKQNKSELKKRTFRERDQTEL